MVSKGNGGRWNVEVIRNLNDLGVDEYEVLLHLLSDVQVYSDRDQLLWKLKKNGEFTVKSFYDYLIGVGVTRWIVSLPFGRYRLLQELHSLLGR